MAVTQSIFYPIKDDDAAVVKLRIVIGQAQKGATSVHRGGTLIVSTNDDVVDVDLGTGAAVRGQKFYCATVVTDVNPQTNLTSVTWELTGGDRIFAKACTETLDHDGDSVLYVAVITCL